MNSESWSIVARKDAITHKTVMVLRGIAFTWIVDNLDAQEHLQPCFDASPCFSFDPSAEETYRLNIQVSRCAFKHTLYLTAFHKCSAKTFCVSVIADDAEIVRREVTCQSSEATRSFLLDNSTVFQNMCLVGDQLVIRIEPKQAVRRGDGPARTPARAPAVGGTLRLAEDMKRILQDTKFSDVVLRSEGRDIRAHRAILSGRSDVFERMIQQPPRESQDGDVQDRVVDVEHGAVDVKDGVADVEDSVVEVEDGVVDVKDNVEDVVDGVVDVVNGVVDVEGGVGDVAHNPIQRLVTYVHSVFERMFQILTRESQDDFVDVEDCVAEVVDGNTDMEDGVIEVEDGVLDVVDGVVDVEDRVVDVEDHVVDVEEAVVGDEDGVLGIEDVAHDTLQRLVTYLYTGQMTEQLTYESAMALFVASDKYDVHDLRDICAEVILQDLCIDNYFRVLGLANKHDHARLRKACKAFIEDHYLLEMEKLISQRARRLGEDMKRLLQEAKFSDCRTTD